MKLHFLLAARPTSLTVVLLCLRPLSFLPALSVDGMIIRSWHVWDLRPSPSDPFWILNVSISWNNRKQEDSLWLWQNLCAATSPLQRGYGSIRSWRSSFVTLVGSVCVHGFASTFDRASLNKQTCPVWPCKAGEVLTLFLVGRWSLKLGEKLSLKSSELNNTNPLLHLCSCTGAGVHSWNICYWRDSTFVGFQKVAFLWFVGIGYSRNVSQRNVPFPTIVSGTEFLDVL